MSPDLAVTVRDATPEDWPALWPILQPIIAAGDTFSYDPEMDEAEARETWMLAPPARTAVAVTADGTVAGTANAHPNHGGPGAHVASGNFMVPAGHAGQGVGRALVQDAIAWARAQGYRAMVFNAVAASNVRAVRLYESEGFEILATIPEAFRHPAEGYVGLHVMHLRL